MTIAILAPGSRGDTQPYLALALALQGAGQHVRVAAFENYADWICGLGLEFSPIKGDVAAVVAGGMGGNARGADNPLRVLLSFNELGSLLYGVQEDLLAACAGVEAIVYHPAAPLGYFVAREWNIPAILATPFPMTPTREYPALIFYQAPRLGGGFNQAGHKAFERIMWSAGSSALKRFWKEQFGRTPAGFSSPFSRQNSRKYPTIISCSSYVFPRPADWPEHVHQTGYWFLDEAGSWQPAVELVDFLEAGEPPVYIGFGSVGDPGQAAKAAELMVQALRRTNRRGILAGGWGGTGQPDGPAEDVFTLESAPHSWLFPQMAAVVHHGGAGTTAAGLRAGVPGIIIPHGNDQFAWAKRVEELGAGPAPIARKKLTTDGLSAAIEAALHPDVRARSAELGRKIREEQGALEAVRVIEDALAA